MLSVRDGFDVKMASGTESNAPKETRREDIIMPGVYNSVLLVYIPDGLVGGKGPPGRGSKGARARNGLKASTRRRDEIGSGWGSPRLAYLANGPKGDSLYPRIETGSPDALADLPKCGSIDTDSPARTAFKTI